MTATKHRPRWIDAAEVAKLLRKTLRTEFPDVKFSVRTHKYAGGASVDVRYTDGPMQRDVQEVCDRYSGASFDGMQDLMSYHDSMLSTDEGAEVVHFAANFVFAERDISDEWRTELEAEIAAFAGQPFDNLGEYAATGRDGELAHDHHYTTNGATLVHQLAQGRAQS